MINQLAEKDAEIAGFKAKLSEQEEYISKMKEQSEKGTNIINQIKSSYGCFEMGPCPWSGSSI